jgi:hypothetical protein
MVTPATPQRLLIDQYCLVAQQLNLEVRFVRNQRPVHVVRHEFSSVAREVQEFLLLRPKFEDAPNDWGC